MPKTADQQCRYVLKRVEFNMFGFNALQCEKYADENWEMVIHPQECGPSDRVVVATMPGEDRVCWWTEGGIRRSDMEDFSYATTKDFADELLEVAEQMRLRWEKMVAKGKRLKAKWAAEEAAERKARKAVQTTETTETTETEEAA